MACERAEHDPMAPSLDRAPSPPRAPSAVGSLDASTLELVFYYAGLEHVQLWLTHPDYATLKACSLVHSSWRRPAQSVLCRHIRVASPESIAAIRSRDARRLISDHKTHTLDSVNQFGIDSYWLLDRVGAKQSLKAFGITYDPLRGREDGQAERDDEWLEWDILRHPALTGVKDLCCKAQFKDPSDVSPITLPLTHLTLGKLPFEHSPALHHALLSSMNATLRTVSLDFDPDPVAKAALDDLIEQFHQTATTLETLHFLNKPNLNFLMSLHSKMNATKMPNFYSVTYPLLPKALAPFNVLCLACINNGTSLVEFKLVEPPYWSRDELYSEEDHEALVLRYLAAFGSRLDSFNIMGRRFRFMFPRQWSAKFVKMPESAKFIDRASARGCDVWCGSEQRFSAAAKAVEKRKGKRVATGGSADAADNEEEEDGSSSVPIAPFSTGPPPPVASKTSSQNTSNHVEQAVLRAAEAAAAASSRKKKGKQVGSPASMPRPASPSFGAVGSSVGGSSSSSSTSSVLVSTVPLTNGTMSKGKGKGKAVERSSSPSAKGKGKAVESGMASGSKGKGKMVESPLAEGSKGKGKAKA
ncbi:hypothetical protein JCM10212_006430 [Sporobolomyces blumeae]